MSTSNELIETLTGMVEQNRQLIELIAEENGAEHVIETEPDTSDKQKAALFGFESREKAAGSRSDGEKAADGMIRNTKNLAKLAEAVGVPSYKIPDSAEDVERKQRKAKFMGTDGSTTSEKDSRTDAEFLGLGSGED